MIKIKLNELKNIIVEAINEMAYPTNFSLNEFINLNTYAKRIKYCQEKLKRISSGSSRIVYQIDNEKVLKIAKNKKGIAQNIAENDYVIQTHDIVAKVFEADNNGLFNEMELANRVNQTIFKKILGFDFNNIYSYLNYAVKRLTSPPNFRHDIKTKEEINFINNNEWLNELADLVAETNMPIGDLCKLDSYGIVNRNGKQYIVLIDYGLTNKIFDDYYK